jgi:hypothetical protein
MSGSARRTRCGLPLSATAPGAGGGPTFPRGRSRRSRRKRSRTASRAGSGSRNASAARRCCRRRRRLRFARTAQATSADARRLLIASTSLASRAEKRVCGARELGCWWDQAAAVAVAMIAVEAGARLMGFRCGAAPPLAVGDGAARAGEGGVSSASLWRRGSRASGVGCSWRSGPRLLSLRLRGRRAGPCGWPGAWCRWPA